MHRHKAELWMVSSREGFERVQCLRPERPKSEAKTLLEGDRALRDDHFQSSFLGAKAEEEDDRAQFKKASWGCGPRTSPLHSSAEARPRMASLSVSGPV